MSLTEFQDEPAAPMAPARAPAPAPVPGLLVVVVVAAGEKGASVLLVRSATSVGETAGASPAPETGSVQRGSDAALGSAERTLTTHGETPSNSREGTETTSVQGGTGTGENKEGGSLVVNIYQGSYYLHILKNFQIQHEVENAAPFNSMPISSR